MLCGSETDNSPAADKEKETKKDFVKMELRWAAIPMCSAGPGAPRKRESSKKRALHTHGHTVHVHAARAWAWIRNKTHQIGWCETCAEHYKCSGVPTPVAPWQRLMSCLAKSANCHTRVKCTTLALQLFTRSIMQGVLSFSPQAEPMDSTACRHMLTHELSPNKDG